MSSQEACLKIVVETVVGPIAASGGRKDRMREELYRHVLDLYEEECARGLDPKAALEEALRRFGEASSLRRELQYSVPRIERIMYHPLPFLTPGARAASNWLAGKKGTSAVNHASRVTVNLVVGVTGPLLLLVLLIPEIRDAPPSILRHFFRFTDSLVAAQFVCCFFLVLASDFILRLTWDRPVPISRKVQAWAWLLASAVLVAAVMAIAWRLNHGFLGVWREASAPSRIVNTITLILLPIPLLMSIYVGEVEKERRRREWNDLSLSD